MEQSKLKYEASCLNCKHWKERSNSNRDGPLQVREGVFQGKFAGQGAGQAAGQGFVDADVGGGGGCLQTPLPYPLVLLELFPCPG